MGRPAAGSRAPRDEKWPPAIGLIDASCGGSAASAKFERMRSRRCSNVVTDWVAVTVPAGTGDDVSSQFPTSGHLTS